MKASPSPRDLGFLAVLVSKYRWLLVAGGALLLLESGATLAVPALGGLIADELLQPDTAHLGIRFVLLAMLVVLAVQAMLKFAAAYVLDSLADRIVADLKVTLYDHLQALPVAYYHRHRLGDTLALLTTDVYVISAFITGTLAAMLPLLVTAAGAVLMMLRIRADLALVALLLIPILLVMLKIVGRRLRPVTNRLQEEEAAALAIAHENLAMLPAIKAFGRERHESGRYRGQVGQILHLSTLQRRIYVALAPSTQFLAAAGLMFVLALAGADVTDRLLAPGALVSFLLYAQLLTRPVAGLADVYGNTQAMRAALARLWRAMKEPRESPGGAPMPPIIGDIEFKGVSFAYEGRPPALNKLDLHIRAGETVVIVGRNGAGKSTIGHLLMRLHDPAEGRITIDGIDINGVSLDGLRSQIGVVPQHVMLFNASIRENIAYGHPEPDPAAVVAAARAAGAHEFVVQLPQGYDTVVGDRGVRLSGGQRQRIALARAVLKNAPIIILDEATAMFDPEGEADFLRASRAIFKRRTVIWITHRPPSIAAAARVIRIERGSVQVDSGGLDTCSSSASSS